MCGTPSYMAPEVILRERDVPYTSKVDCWSVGAVNFTMLVSYLPKINLVPISFPRLTGTECFEQDKKIPVEQFVAKREVKWANLFSLDPRITYEGASY